MKNIRIIQFILLVFVIGLSSCGGNPTTKERNYQHSNMGELLMECKGNAVVKAKGVNEGNFDSYKHYLIIVDDSSNCFEYVGAEYSVSVGDTLK